MLSKYLVIFPDISIRELTFLDRKHMNDDKSDFVFESMLLAKFTHSHTAFGRGICHLL